MTEMNQNNDAGQKIRAMMQVSPAAAWVRGIVGATVGGAVGYFVFKWLLSQGYYGLASALVSLRVVQ